MANRELRPRKVKKQGNIDTNSRIWDDLSEEFSYVSVFDFDGRRGVPPTDVEEWWLRSISTPR